MSVIHRNFAVLLFSFDSFQNTFVFVVIDGNQQFFDLRLLNQATEGGVQAAERIGQEIGQDIARLASAQSLGEVQLWITVLLNVSDVQNRLMELEDYSYSNLHQFAYGFNSASPRYLMASGGPESELVTSKVIGTLVALQMICD